MAKTKADPFDPKPKANPKQKATPKEKPSPKAKPAAKKTTQKAKTPHKPPSEVDSLDSEEARVLEEIMAAMSENEPDTSGSNPGAEENSIRKKTTPKPKASASKRKRTTGDKSDSDDDTPIDSLKDRASKRVKKAKPDPVWYFKPASPLSVTANPNHTIFSIILYHAIHHVMAVGILLHDFQSTTDGAWIEPPLLEDGTFDAKKDTKKKAAVKKFLCKDPRIKDIADPPLLRYLEITLGTWSDGDKYMPIRMKAPSMMLVSSIFPSYTDEASQYEVQVHALTLFRLALIRIFGVGDPVLIKKLANAADCNAASNTILTSFPADKNSMNRTVYGQMLLARETIPKAVEGCNRLASSLAEKLVKQEAKLSFKDVRAEIIDADVLWMREDGLLIWLFGCDLAALGYCEEATWDDLADKMGIVDDAENSRDDEQPEPAKVKGKRKSLAKPKTPKKATTKSVGGSGPHKALEMVAEMARKKAAELAESNGDDHFLFRNEMKIKAIMTQKSAFINECKVIVSQLNEVFQDHFEKLGMSAGILPRDMEHFLCKISRMEGRAKFIPWKEPALRKAAKEKAFSKGESSKGESSQGASSKGEVTKEKVAPTEEEDKMDLDEDVNAEGETDPDALREIDLDPDENIDPLLLEGWY